MATRTAHNAGNLTVFDRTVLIFAVILSVISVNVVNSQMLVFPQSYPATYDGSAGWNAPNNIWQPSYNPGPQPGWNAPPPMPPSQPWQQPYGTTPQPWGPFPGQPNVPNPHPRPGSWGIYPEGPMDPAVVCRLKYDQGDCLDTVRKYAFDFKTNKCIPFLWTGCGGNQNRFETKDECEKLCKDEE
ncbi:Kunitz/Bovine pancreatic trypsin inhibitor domain protein [Oesophagostomum dentatum]|uniref:Kunitz/Bovine pancreatic trypsin inhibitor domain protein n=1 Tax=Oesophagostomum dentatum TaxID=61180 RepID=A0A0B1SVW2_OESDE|nr:Kunitz/Bovine pancreatic trypsin inhibitor domain protein [Oesophagostomum dentatum]